ncbi:metal-dependent transcriptional regulator [uncultured Brachyspira sp.]|uniref:metal-dependent transcriptional regulator n=1 Tax=uncultured Brachyspira sp. TaxID=221953 RepID=UPI00261C28D2|nr:metal-dependent transcriptional regulator [uncultured Brachyspira sp.]
MKQEITPILENYLETIYNLEMEKNSKESIRITDIADVAGRSKASVNTAIKTLSKLGHIKHEHYGDIELTNSGRAIGKDIAERHAIFYYFLNKVLNIDEKIADKEACLIEHAMSKDTVYKFKEFLCGYCKKENIFNNSKKN